jgi:hypothetical protein
MSDMMADIAKYSKIWDDALEKGIFKDAPKPPQPSEPRDSADFFGNYLSGEYDMDKPLNEVDVQYWRNVSRMAGVSGGKYVDPLLMVEDARDPLKLPTAPKVNKKPSSFEELRGPSTEIGEQSAKAQDKVRMQSNDPNPQSSNAYGPDSMDGDAGTTRISAGWAAADKNIIGLEELKKSLYELECKMSDSEGLSDSKVKSLDGKMKDLKKQIDELSNAIVPRYPADHVG